MALIQQWEFWKKKMDIVHKVEEENGHNNKSQFERDQLVVNLSSLPVLNLLPGDRYFWKVKLDNLSRIFFKSQYSQGLTEASSADGATEGTC